MHLRAPDAPSARDLQQAVGESLDRRLLRDHPRAVAVALSGGGDSLALLLAAADWAKAGGRRLLVLTVDHGLRPESAGWTGICAATAQRLGLDFRALGWAGEKPATGLPAAARAARHALLADAARAAGARVIMMGHTADDLMETRLMREAGSTTPDPREWTPSPAWPEGRGVFLLRPMLDIRRADIRDWLRVRGETWIDDPANEDTAYARPRARQALDRDAIPAAAGAIPTAAALALACRADEAAGFEIARDELRAAAPAAVTRFLSAACLCAAGTTRPPARAQVKRLAGRLEGHELFVASLAGARVEADLGHVRFRREAGEAARGGLAPLRLVADETGVWDGRYQVSAEQAVEIRAARGSTAPLALRSDGETEPLRSMALTRDRLLAACGAIESETP